MHIDYTWQGSEKYANLQKMNPKIIKVEVRDMIHDIRRPGFSTIGIRAGTNYWYNEGGL